MLIEDLTNRNQEGAGIPNNFFYHLLHPSALHIFYDICKLHLSSRLIHDMHGRCQLQGARLEA